MKYEDTKVVHAIYDQSSDYDNPFLEAMPELLDRKVFYERIKSIPTMPYNLSELPPEKRRMLTGNIYKLFIPMDYMYSIYDMFYQAIHLNYSSQTTINSIRQLNSLYRDLRSGQHKVADYTTQSFSGALLGAPGIGKTSTIRRCLDLIPQVIIHENYYNKPLYHKQITYLAVECPSDCSIKTLAYNIVAAIDMAIGSQYFVEVSRQSSLSASALATKVKILCMSLHVGLLVIDEIQNAVTTAHANRQLRPLIKFLVELTNETCVSICFAGTMAADDLFDMEDHLKRRTRGLRLLPLKPDIAYRRFIEILWAYQYTIHKTELKDKFANMLYDYSGGVPAYIVKIYQEAQRQAIITGKERINEDLLKEAINLQNIQIPKSYQKGISISDFTMDLTYNEEIEKVELDRTAVNPQFYTKKRGRKTVSRDLTDMIDIFKEYTDTEEYLKKLNELGVVEVIGGVK